MSSVSQGALLTDLMHVSVDQDDQEPPPGLERKVIGETLIKREYLPYRLDPQAYYMQCNVCLKNVKDGENV